MFLPHFKYRRVVKALIVAGVIAVFVYLVLFVKDSITKLNSKYEATTATEAYLELNTIKINGESFLEKENTKTILIIGLDIDGKIESSNSYNNDYNADFIMLATFDTAARVCNLVEINRDSVVPVQRLDIFGQPVDKQNMQICLSYSYGDGLLGQSAANTKKAVSNIFYGINIDYCLVLSRSATKAAVDYLGGVDVTMDEDYTDIDPDYVKGSTHKMDSESAMSFVTARYGTKYGTNVYRINRQMCLLNSLVAKLQVSDINVSDIFNAFGDYALTDVDFTVFSGIISEIGDYRIPPVVTPSGKSVLNYGYNEFYMDESSVLAIAGNVFYDRI